MKKVLCVLVPVLVIVLSAGVSSADAVGTPSYVNAFVYDNSSIRITWDNSVSGATRYTIQRKTDSGDFVTIANVSANVSSYTDGGITNGHTYVYRVFAVKDGVSGSPRESYPVEFLYPTGLTLEPLSDSEVKLTWTYPSTNKIPESNYQTVIERRLHDSNTWFTVATVPGNQYTYTDKGLSEYTRYYYRIRSITSTTALYLYYPATSSGMHVYTLLKAPENVRAEIISTGAIKITWDDVSKKETGYRIERKTGTGYFVRIGTAATNATSYIDRTAVNGQLYTYRVIPYSPYAEGMASEEVKVPFLFPVDLKIAGTYSTQVVLSWEYPNQTYVLPENSVVIIERKKSGSTRWEEIHTSRPGETEYTDNDLEPGTTYYYRIKARYDGGFTTDYLPSADGITANTKLSFETYFYGRAISDTEILLEWSKEAAGKHSIVLEKLDTEGNFKPVRSFKETGSYVDKVTKGSLNVYRLKLRSDSMIESEYTPAIYVTAEQLPRVQNLEIKSIVPNRVYLAWEYDRAQESSFEIWRMAGSEGLWKHIGTASGGQYMFADENVVNGETYTYQVRAVKNSTVFSEFTVTEPVRIFFSKNAGNLELAMIDGKLYLAWEDFSDMEDSYVVEYRTGLNEMWRTLGVLGKNSTMFSFVPAEGTDYTIRVRAQSQYPAFETYTNEVFYTTKVPATPSLSIPTVVGSGRVALSWVDFSDNEDEFRIYRKSDVSPDYELIGSVGKDVTVYFDNTVLPERTYSYMVKAKNAAGESFPSNKVDVRTPPVTAYNDISSGFAWAKDAINTLTSMGVIQGDGRGNFNPSGIITRAEFIKLLIATFALPETPIGSFRDVNPDDWYHRYVMTAYRYKIIEPDAKGMFYPNEPITRQDMVYYASRAVKSAGYDMYQPPLYILYKFSDYNEIDTYAQSAFAQMYYAGVINGIGGNRLGPGNTATRAEAATIIYRLVKALEK